MKPKEALSNWAFGFVLLALLVDVSPVQGRSFKISKTTDTTRPGSLRGAIIAASKTHGQGTIVLAPGTYRLTISGADEDSARTGDLDIVRGNVTIIGAGTNTIIDATGLGDRVFHVLPGASLTLSNLVITGGAAPAQRRHFYPNVVDYGDGENGGAICNAGTLTLKNCTVVDCAAGNGYFPGFAYGGSGGGIYNTGTLTMDHCIVAGNLCGSGSGGASGGSGGGIFNIGTLLLNRCTIGNNAAGLAYYPSGTGYSPYSGYGADGGDGGGIYNAGTMVVTDCVISGNTGGRAANGNRGFAYELIDPDGRGGGGGDGAGICNIGKAKLNFCTVSGNTNGNGGDGDFGDTFPNYQPPGGNGGPGGCGAGAFNSGTLVLNTCTISGNVAGTGGAGGDGGSNPTRAGSGGDGGGIYNVGVLSLNACTVAYNCAGDGEVGGRTPTLGGAGGSGGNGGGIWNAPGAVCTNFMNTLVALNSFGAAGAGGSAFATSGAFTNGSAGSNGVGLDLAGDFSSRGFNLLGVSDSSAGFTNGIRSDIVGDSIVPVDPMIGPLQLNRGSTPTHALLPGSPAIDQGNSFGVFVDQRGYPRPFDNPVVSNSPDGDGSDIGAFEVGMTGN